MPTPRTTTPTKERSAVSHGLDGGCGVSRQPDTEALGFDTAPRAAAEEDALAEAAAFTWAFAESGNRRRKVRGAGRVRIPRVQAVVFLLGDGVAVSIGVQSQRQPRHPQNHSRSFEPPFDGTVRFVRALSIVSQSQGC